MFWFHENFMVLNPKKCHFMCLGRNAKACNVFQYNDIFINKKEKEKLLGVYIDSELNFSHIKFICKTTGHKLNALARISSLLNQNQKFLLFNSFIKGQFSYCPLVWMFFSRSSNKLINRIYERSLTIILDNHTESFEELCKRYFNL